MGSEEGRSSAARGCSRKAGLTGRGTGVVGSVLRATRGRATGGFTLIEMMIVVTVIGIVVGMAVVQGAPSKSRAGMAAAKDDLRKIASAQEAYFTEHQRYANAVGDLEVNLSDGVSVPAMIAGRSGWSARVTHRLSDDRYCAMAMGDVTPLPPAEGKGQLECEAGQSGFFGCFGG